VAFKYAFEDLFRFLSIMPSKNSPVIRARGWKSLLVSAGLLILILGLLFYRSFETGEIVFSNDGPLGQIAAQQDRMPATLTGGWQDLNSIGSSFGATSPTISALLALLPPVLFAKTFPLFSLFILGLGALYFFQQSKFSPLASLLGALAIVLNMTYFAGACWGVASVEIAAGFDFFALALIMANTAETPWLVRWTRLALAGLCVGINVMEASDVGALFSLLIAAFAFFKSFVDGGGNFLTKTGRGIGRVAIVAAFAGFIATQTAVSLVGTSISGVAGAAQDSETKSQHWDWATQWSLPKAETLGLFVPGLFGYKMDTPNEMMPAFQEAYRGGFYWGGIGRDPAVDRFFDSGGQGQPPVGFMRFTGGGNYCGILVALVAVWTIAQSFRRQNSPFSTKKIYMVLDGDFNRVITDSLGTFCAHFLRNTLPITLFLDHP
jgi:hypothetical protein